MEIRHLRAVAALADELHFGRAARRLAVTQPALSQQVSQLEHLLDTALFIRQPRVEPTAAGRALAVHARRILAAVDEAESEARSLGYRARRRIRLGYLEYWNPPFLAAAVRRLRELDPPVVLEPRNMHSQEVLAGLIEHTLEVGFVHLPVTDPRLAVRPLVEGRWAVVMPRAHRLARRRGLTRADLAGEPLVLFDRSVNPPLHAWLLGQLAAAKIAPRIVYATTQPQVGIDLVDEGVGLFLIGSYVLRKLPARVVARPLLDLPPLQIAAAWRGDERTPALAALLAALPRLDGRGART